MTDRSQEELDRLERINRRVAPQGPGRGPRIAVGILVLVLLAIGSLWVFAPQQVRSLFGFGTSRPQDMQQPAAFTDGISTEVPRGEAVDTAPLTTELPAAKPKADGLSPEDQLRLDQMEARLKALAEQPGGLTQEQLQAMLDANAAQLREEVRRQLLAQNPVTAGIDPSGAAAEAEARKRMEEEKKRREAIDKAQIASSGVVIDGVNGGETSAGGAGGRRLSENEGFLAAAAEQTHKTVRAEQLADPSRTIVQGTILEGVLETAINTDLPGAIRAVLTEDVVSYDGSTTLLPRGTRLIGAYSSNVKIAQRRALIAWNRAVTPAGASVALGGIGADALGRSGQTGHVDTHFWERFGSAALISVFALGPQFAIDDETDEDVADAIDAMGGDLESTSRSALDAYLRIAPTINVDQGDRLTVFVNRDLVF
ncbi:TrbI/VirB10 family protein [Amaricoccus sp.]|uniref:TrbI/VirB10 family protein n=1 Tax=Amaricoccus sp. TaxID=1872485 RepID=UPI001B508A7F|nr:TrbI/VirB10 family protein [Amaricoccus sp.]MBP7243261.1 TrbI/VirB10 family protein [Amaricoccus sp.]